MDGQITEFDDTPEPVFPNIKQVKIKDAILGNNIIIKDYKVLEGDSGEFYVILARVDGSTEDVSFSCGSKIVMKQVKKLKETNKLPALASFIKRKGQESGQSYMTLGKPIKD